MLSILIVSYFLIGWFMSFLVLNRETCLSERIVFAVAFNIAFISASMHAMGTFGTFDYSLILLTEASIMLLVISAKIDDIGFVLRKATLPKLNRRQAGVVGVIGVQLLLSVYHSMLFPVEGGDPVSYHIPYAIMFWEKGRIVNGVGHLWCCNAFPHAIHVLNSYMFWVNGGFEEGLVRALSPVMLAMIALLTFLFIQTTEGKKAAYVGVLLLFSVPYLIAHGQSAYINLPDVFFVSLGLYYLFKGLDSNRYLFLSGAFGGFAMLVKPSAIIFYFIAIPIMFFFRNKLSWRGMGWFGVGCLVFLGPLWYIRNITIWGTPFYPHLPVGETAPYSMSRLKFLLLYMFDDQININWGHGPMFLTFGIIGLCYTKWKGFSYEEQFMLLWLICGAAATAVFLQNGRHMLHMIIPQVYFAAKGALWLLSKRDWVRTASVAYIIVLIIPPLALGAYGFKNMQIRDGGFSFHLPIPPSNRSEFLREQWGEIYEAFEFVYGTPNNATFLTNQPDLYLMERDIYISRNFEFESVEVGVGELKRAGVGYVYHNKNLPVNPIGEELFNSLNDTMYFTPVFNNNIVEIYKIR